ncbi:unnamed protein product [Gadus morhua 'NCC']
MARHPGDVTQHPLNSKHFWPSPAHQLSVSRRRELWSCRSVLSLCSPSRFLFCLGGPSVRWSPAQSTAIALRQCFQLLLGHCLVWGHVRLASAVPHGPIDSSLLLLYEGVEEQM